VADVGELFVAAVERAEGADGEPNAAALSECTFSRSRLPITGNWTSAESMSLACRCGFPSSMRPRMVTRNSSRGNSYRNP
jgi:hypothetical protein